MSLSLNDLLAAKADPHYYISKPLLPKRGVMVIGGPSKTFKSMIALNMAYELAEAKPLFGLQAKDEHYLWPVTQPQRILYVEQEIGQARLKERLQTLHNTRQGQYAPYYIHFMCKGSGASLEGAGLELLRKEIELVKPDVLVLDPLRKFHDRDEDSSTEMKQVFDAVDSLSKQYKLTTIMVHHAAKRSEFRKASDPECLRGSGEIFATGDTYIIIEKLEKNVIKLNFTLRSAEDPHPLTLRFDSATGTFARASS